MKETRNNGGNVKKTPPCPTCGRPRVQEYRPFCSPRCRDVDLNRWFNQVYTIPAAQADESADAEEDDQS